MYRTGKEIELGEILKVLMGGSILEPISVLFGKKTYSELDWKSYTNYPFCSFPWNENIKLSHLHLRDLEVFLFWLPLQLGVACDYILAKGGSVLRLFWQVSLKKRDMSFLYLSFFLLAGT